MLPEPSPAPVPPPGRIAGLVVVPEREFRNELVAALRLRFPQLRFLSASSGRETLRMIGTYPLPMLVLNHVLPDISTLYLSTLAKALSPTTCVVVLTPTGNDRQRWSMNTDCIDHRLPRQDCTTGLIPVIADVLHEEPCAAPADMSMRTP